MRMKTIKKGNRKGEKLKSGRNKKIREKEGG